MILIVPRLPTIRSPKCYDSSRARKRAPVFGSGGNINVQFTIISSVGVRLGERRVDVPKAERSRVIVSRVWESATDPSYDVNRLNE